NCRKDYLRDIRLGNGGGWDVNSPIRLDCSWDSVRSSEAASWPLCNALCKAVVCCRAVCKVFSCRRAIWLSALFCRKLACSKAVVCCTAISRAFCCCWRLSGFGVLTCWDTPFSCAADCSKAVVCCTAVCTAFCCCCWAFCSCKADKRDIERPPGDCARAAPAQRKGASAATTRTATYVFILRHMVSSFPLTACRP